MSLKYDGVICIPFTIVLRYICTFSHSNIQETLGLVRVRESRNLLKTRDLMDERNPQVKSHIPGDEFHREIF